MDGLSAACPAYCHRPLRETLEGNTMELPSRKVVIEQMRAQGKRIAAVLPIHSPRALLRAYGYHPVEVWGPPGVDVSTGASHFQAYTCSIVRNGISFVLGDAS